MSESAEPVGVHLHSLKKEEAGEELRTNDGAKIPPNPPLPKGGTKPLPKPKSETRPISASDRAAGVRRTVIVLVVLVVMGYVGFIVMMGWR